MDCPHYSAKDCRSCSLLEIALPDQIRSKEAHCRALFKGDEDILWLPTFSGPEAGFRNKAKMAVSGSAAHPVLGIVDSSGRGVDLTDCPLYPAALSAVFPFLSDFVTEANLIPYDVQSRRGELKYILLTYTETSGRFMVRFVLRSRETLGRIKKYLPGLLERLPSLAVVSVNLQPVHQAILEGEEEIILTGQEDLTMELNGLPIHLRPQGFFQTNSTVAAELYRQARDWVNELGPASVWDLFCGAGGFALHCADGRREVTGIEVSGEAIAGAELSQRELKLDRLTFRSMDAAGFTLEAAEAPEMVIVNPPRRGVGEVLCRYLENCTARHIIYSSCNRESLSADLARMPGWQVTSARVLDMFPHTSHYEVITLLSRRRNGD